MDTDQSAVSVRAPMAEARAKRASSSHRSLSTCRSNQGCQFILTWLLALGTC